jgi:hypothetical protein
MITMETWLGSDQLGSEIRSAAVIGCGIRSAALAACVHVTYHMHMRMPKHMPMLMQCTASAALAAPARPSPPMRRPCRPHLATINQCIHVHRSICLPAWATRSKQAPHFLP